MGPAIERLTGVPLTEQRAAWLVGMGHGGTHWVIGTFYLLLPAIRDDLGLSYALAGTLIGVFHVASFVANFASGAASDLIGRKVMLQVLSLVFGGLALALSGSAGGYLSLAALVVIIGATNNLWHPPAISYLSARYPERRGYALSLHAMGASIGDAIAPAVAGALLVWVGWRVAAPVAAAPVLLVAILLLITLAPGERRAVQAGGGALAGKDYLSGIRRLIANRQVAMLCVTAGFRTMTLNGLLVFLPLYLADVAGLDLWLVGLMMTAMQVGGLIATPAAGIWSDRKGRRPVVIAGLTVTTMAIALLTLIDHELVLVAGIAVLGFGLYAVRPVMHSWMMDVTPDELGGSATSLMFGTQSLLSMLVPPLGGVLADQYGLTAVFYGLAVTILIANLLVLAVPRKP